MDKIGMYSSKWTHRIQTLWIASVIVVALMFIMNCPWSLWLSVPAGIIGCFLASWIGISVIAMFDYNHRMAAKYGVKIENLPLYFCLFERLVEMESRGIDSSGIPAEVSDVEDWLRFCRWQLMEKK